MKRILNGKIYDTDTADRLTMVQTDTIRREIGRTPRGNYFEMFNGTPIKPMTEKQARTAAEYSDQVTIEQYEAFFGPVTDA